MPESDSTPASRQRWRVSTAGRLCGLVDGAGLRRLAEAGRLARYSLVQREGVGDWRIICAVPELMALLPDLPTTPTFTFRRILPSPSQIIAIIAVVWLVGGYWTCRGVGIRSEPALPSRTMIPQPQSSAAELAAQATTALRERRWAAGLEAGRRYLAVADGSATAILKQKQDWAELILEQLTPDRDRTPATQALPVLKTCLDWVPERAAQVAQRGLVFAQDALSTGPLQVDDAEAYFNFALEIGRGETPTSVTQIAWEAIAKRLTDPPSLGREALGRLFARCVIDDLPETVTEHPAWLLAEALQCQERSDWDQALPRLRDVAASTADPTLAQVARKILAPPEPGRREYQRPSVVFRTPAKRPALRIELLAAEVTSDSTTMQFCLSNTAVRRQKLTYSVAVDGSGQVFRRGYDPLCLIDDHGQRVTAPLGFGGAGQPVQGQDNLRVIELARGKSIELEARFPLIDPGATRVRFVSPAVQGQSEWGWADIPLKAGPFDPPLPLLPPQSPKLQPVPEIQPVVAHETDTTTSALVRTMTEVTTGSAGVSPVKSDDDLAVKSEDDKKSPSVEVSTPQDGEGKEGNVRSDTKLGGSDRARATAARQMAEQKREQCRSRMASGNRALKQNLFDSADQQRQTAEAAYKTGDYVKAGLYFEQAMEIYKQITK